MRHERAGRAELLWQPWSHRVTNKPDTRHPKTQHGRNVSGHALIPWMKSLNAITMTDVDPAVIARMPSAMMIVAIRIAPRCIVRRMHIVLAAAARRTWRASSSQSYSRIVAARLVTVAVRIDGALGHIHMTIARVITIMHDSAVVAAIVAMAASAGDAIRPPKAAMAASKAKSGNLRMTSSQVEKEDLKPSLIENG